MNKQVKILIVIGILIILFIILFIAINKTNILSNKATKLESVSGITVVPTMNDTITADSSWCGTFQLVWNDMKNEVVKKDIVFSPQLDMVKNLNKEDFNESMLSEDYYFKIYGLKSLALKEQIENGIKEKFNQTSDILNDFDWSENGLDDPNNANTRRYFFYTMLYRKFEYLQEFDKLENDKFGDKYKDIEYFGIDKNTKNSVGNQIEVLYYNSKDDFAILINTKTNDEVIFCKSPKGSDFNEIYDNMNNEANKYTGSKSFNTAEIQKAIQTIKFSLDEKGGEIKSEAAIDMTLDATSIGSKPKADEPRYFYVDDTFAIFLREKGKSKPYFVGRIDDITKFQ